MSTLLEGGLTVHDIGHERAARIVTFLRAAMDQHGGRLGFGILHLFPLATICIFKRR
jgi:hypothetical protein